MKKSQAILLLDDSTPKGVRCNPAIRDRHCVLGRFNTDPENDQGITELDDEYWGIIALVTECFAVIGDGLASLYGREESVVDLNLLMVDPASCFTRMGKARQGTHTGLWVYTTDRPD